MFRALLKKEWTQLLALRWIGLGLGACLPPFLLAVAEAARRGRLPFGRISDYSVEQLLTNALPFLAAGLWGLMALLFTAQSFAGDRAAGTESFLLERPVPRARIWWARLLAALASLWLLILVHVALWLALARLVVGPAGSFGVDDLLILASAGAVVGLVGFVAGVAAASFVSSPIQAVLLGLILAAVPPGLSMFLAGLSPLALIGRIPVGAAIPWLLLLPGYLLASYRICCRGEPAGKGRLRRGLGILGASVLLVALSFLVGVPWVLRAGARRLESPDLIVARKESRAVCVIDGSWRLPSAWLVDTVRARKLRFFAPPVERAAWNREGSLLALAHHAGPLGGYRAGATIDFFDDGGRVAGSRVRLALDETAWIRELLWAGGELVAAVQSASSGGGVLIVSPGSGAIRRVPLGERVLQWDLLGPTETGELFVQLMIDPEGRRYVLRRLDVARAELEPDPLLDVEGLPTWAGRWISPSGRYWMGRVGQRGEGLRVVDLHAGEDRPVPECLWARWMSGDRLACLEATSEGRRLTVGTPGETREEIGAWPRSTVTVEVSPERRRLLIQVWEQPDGRTGPGASTDRVFWSQNRRWRVGRGLLRALLYDDAGRSVTDLAPRWEAWGSAADGLAVWAGPETLAFTGEGSLVFADLDGEVPPRPLFGRP